MTPGIALSVPMVGNFLSERIFISALIFARIGGALSFMPGFGEASVSPRLRLGIALSISFCLHSVAPPQVQSVAKTLSLEIFLGEVLLGLLAGILARIALLSLETTGSAMAMFSGLHLSSFFSPLSASGGSAYGTFLTMTALTLMFSCDIHHWFLKSLVESYEILAPGEALALFTLLTNLPFWVSRCFQVAVQLAAPFLVTQLLFFLGVGLVNRLVSQMQVYFLAQPLQILAGVFTLLLCLSPLLHIFFSFFEEAIFVKFLSF